ncbi:MAG: phytanoyl-CoA dioxygenase family protein [Planctomycetota bacterium]|nr:phytanoyl-CoA dioxygenase family protein [Planctomycetota bacterium]
MTLKANETQKTAPSVIQRPLGFQKDTLPWLDRMLQEIDREIEKVEESPAARLRLRQELLTYMHNGYVILEGAIEHKLIDAYLADVYDLFDDRRLNVKVSGHYQTYLSVHEYEDSDYYKHGLRIIDFHNSSIAAKKISLHKRLTQFLKLVFRQQIVAMQSLTFMKSTQQEIHQDFAYVVAEIPSHLAASWVALEDIDPESGPLCYYPGSHTNQMFDWGNGMFRTQESTGTDAEFAAHIHGACKDAGQKIEHFHPKKGDVLIWHGALAHGGALAKNPELTRKSYVTHYSTKAGFQHDYRAKDQEPYPYEYNGGLVYRHPFHPDEEDYYDRGARF